MDLLLKRNYIHSWFFLFFSGFFWRLYQDVFPYIYDLPDIKQLSPIILDMNVNNIYYGINISLLIALSVTPIIILYDYLYYNYLKRNISHRIHIDTPVYHNKKYILNGLTYIFIFLFINVLFSIITQVLVNLYYRLNDNNGIRDEIIQFDLSQTYIYSRDKDMTLYDDNYKTFTNFYYSMKIVLTQMIVSISFLLLFNSCLSMLYFSDIYDKKTKRKYQICFILQYSFASIGYYLCNGIFFEKNIYNYLFSGVVVSVCSLIGLATYVFLNYVLTFIYTKYIKKIRINNNRELVDLTYTRHVNSL
jgi:hypothetical protein